MEDVCPLWEGDTIDLGYWKFEVILIPVYISGTIMRLEHARDLPMQFLPCIFIILFWFLRFFRLFSENFI